MEKGIDMGQIVVNPAFYMTVAGFKQDNMCKMLNAGLYVQKARKNS